jgi:TRAP-type C4-dicarboxylate transport system permease small subunit
MAMVLLMVIDILLRRFFNSPLSWSLEVIQVMLVVVVFFSVAYCGARKGHISVELITSRLPSKTLAIIDIITHFLGIVLFIFMAWGSCVLAINEFESHHVTGILPIPIYPFVFVVMFGSAMLAVVLIVQLTRVIIDMVSK